MICKRSRPARAEPREPFAHRPDGHRRSGGDLGCALTCHHAGADLLSTVHCQAGTMMRVAYLAGPSAVVQRLQPDRVPAEQPSETSRLAPSKYQSHLFD